MIEIIAYLSILLSLIILGLSIGLYFYIKYRHHKKINSIFNIDNAELLENVESEKTEDFKIKLVRAGITKKEFHEIIAASVVAGAALVFLTFLIEFSPLIKIAIIILGICVALFTPVIYLQEQMKGRIKRIDNDLAIFIDLLIIILEGGGGLNNAIDRVTIDGENVLGKDLLEESKKFKNEFITYSSEIAYNNLAMRTGSEAIASIVGFMKLSEETGIGVKTIFENQALDIKAAEMLNVEKSAAGMNIGITLVMFIFIIPAVIAMIAFPMSANALIPGF